ncbi:WD repeat-containing protein 31 [Phytophthora nicotianae]|uniref:WD repeat-containing protein 31 n=1 Tax=Phytophthora nicotianae TaxID=4792 RepID=A0A0W8CYN1_PHYNI|nr:WD repeat-containing protein 31 [Phytophthora nicotianae]
MRGYAIAAEKSLGQIWNELTKKGWLFRKSLGLSDDRRYLPPGGSLKGTDGVDYLLAAVPDAVVPDITDIDIPDVEDTGPDTTQEPVSEVTTTSAEVTSDDGTTAGRSLLDAFGSDDFLDAFCRDRLFGPLESDDLNVGE